jgi:hypothetical protein
MHEDREQVDELQEALEAAGILVWRDSQDLWPGENWQSKIREAIESGSLAFIACFSKNTEKREKSYQYEELTLAAEQYRLRPPNSSWLFTVRFDDCTIPEIGLGAGRSLESVIQRTDLFGANKTVQTIRLSQAVSRIVQPASVGNSGIEARAEAKLASSNGRTRAETLKLLLRDPSGDIALEDFMTSIGADLREKLSDEIAFPATLDAPSRFEFAEAWIGEVRKYEEVVEPALDLVRLAAIYGKPQHNAAWERFMRLVASQVVGGDGNQVLLRLRAYPSLILMYVACIAGVSRGNYSPLLGLISAVNVKHASGANGSVKLVLFTNVRAVAENVESFASALAKADEGEEITSELIEGLATKSIGGRLTPISDHLRQLLKGLFRDDFADERDYDAAFDQAEVLLDAIVLDQAKENGRFTSWAGGFGSYTWRHRHSEHPVELQMRAELDESGDAWPPLLDGLFFRDKDRASAALLRVNEVAAEVRQRHW